MGFAGLTFEAAKNAACAVPEQDVPVLVNHVHALSAIVLSAAACEGFINEIGDESAAADEKTTPCAVRSFGAAWRRATKQPLLLKYQLANICLRG